MNNIINSINISGIVVDDSFSITKASGASMQVFRILIDGSFVDKRNGELHERVASIKCNWYNGTELSAGDHVVISGKYAVTKSEEIVGQIYLHVHTLAFLND